MNLPFRPKRPDPGVTGTNIKSSFHIKNLCLKRNGSTSIYQNCSICSILSSFPDFPFIIAKICARVTTGELSSKEAFLARNGYTFMIGISQICSFMPRDTQPSTPVIMGWKKAQHLPSEQHTAFHMLKRYNEQSTRSIQYEKTCCQVNLIMFICLYY